MLDCWKKSRTCYYAVQKAVSIFSFDIGLNIVFIGTRTEKKEVYETVYNRRKVYKNV